MRSLGVLLVIGAVTWFCARHAYVDGRFVRDEPHVVTGDEPHYLLMVQAALRGEFADLRAAYARARAGGPELGAHLSGKPIDHHVIVTDPVSGDHLDWIEVYDARPEGYQPCRGFGCEEFRRKTERLRGPLVREAPLHPVLLPWTFALLLAPLRLEPSQVEAWMGALLLALSVAGVAASWAAARRGGFTEGAALACAALVGLCSPWLPYSKSYFAETVVGLVIAGALWALAAERGLLAAFLAALAAALKPQYAVVGAALLVQRGLAGRWRDVLRMGALLGAAGVAVLAGNYALARTPVITASIVHWVFPLSTLWQTLGDLRHGLLLFAPWALLALLGVVRGLRRSAPPLVSASAWSVVLNLVLLSSLSIFGEWCYGPRYWIAFLPPLALCAVDFVRPHGALLKGVLAALALLGLSFAISGALEYSWVFHQPPWLALGAF